MKKTSQFLITRFFISFSLLFQVSCGKYSAYDHLTGKVESDKKIMEDENKAKIDAENKINADTKAKLDSENKLKSDAQAKKQSEGMVFVEGGSFDMGDNTWTDSKPINKVTVSSFYISKYETTQAEYQSIMGKNSIYINGINLPLESVSWFDAIEYCNAKSIIESLPQAYNELTGELLDKDGKITTDITKVKGYRLPSEAEWEYAARGGNKSQGYTYSGSNNEEEVAWFSSNSGGKTHEVGSKKSNELGIYDMSGNVWEWCTDWYNSNYYNNITTINPVNTKSSGYRVYRGGSWFDKADYLRIGYRFYDTPTRSERGIGFRSVRTY